VEQQDLVLGSEQCLTEGRLESKNRVQQRQLCSAQQPNQLRLEEHWWLSPQTPQGPAQQPQELGLGHRGKQVRGVQKLSHSSPQLPGFLRAGFSHYKVLLPLLGCGPAGCLWLKVGITFFS
jgi:hypothetical protein